MKKTRTETHKRCSNCGKMKEFKFFRPYYLNQAKFGRFLSISYVGECYACKLERAGTREMLRREGKLDIKHNAVKVFLRNETYTAKKNGFVLLLDTCELCKERPAIQLHHPDDGMPLETISVCGTCHKSKHTTKPRKIYKVKGNGSWASVTHGQSEFQPAHFNLPSHKKNLSRAAAV